MIGDFTFLEKDTASAYLKALIMLRDRGHTHGMIRNEIVRVNRGLSTIGISSVPVTMMMHAAVNKFTTMISEGEPSVAELFKATMQDKFPMYQTRGWAITYCGPDLLIVRKSIRRRSVYSTVEKLKELNEKYHPILEYDDTTGVKNFTLMCNGEWVIDFDGGSEDQYGCQLLLTTDSRRWSVTSLKWFLRNLGL